MASWHAVDNATSPRVLIVAEHASAKFGGEAVLPLHFFRLLRARGVEAWLIVHERTRAELRDCLPDHQDRIVYIPDTALHRTLWRVGQRLPDRMAYFTTGWLMRLLTQWVQRRLAVQMVRRHSIDVVHQPIPVSPKEPSMLFGVGAPVVIGPMNGGMDYPPGFRQAQHTGTRWVIGAGRVFAAALNVLMPGKALARLLLVANERTRQALPWSASSNVHTLVENGVDFATWRAPQERSTEEESVTRFVFVGRLVDWKAVDLLIEAFNVAKDVAPMTLTIVGDGAERPSLQRQALEAGLDTGSPHVPGKIHFTGWKAQSDCAQILNDSHALVLPSLMECGGAVVLEAMAMGKAVIATAWGGPADYLDEACGILVPALNRVQFVQALSEAMVRLSEDQELCVRMGQRGLLKVHAQFDWQRKIDTILDIYRSVHQHA